MKIFYPPFLTDAKLAAVEWKYSCRSPEDKGLMSVSQTWTARSLCCQPRILGNNMLWRSNRMWLEKGALQGQDSSFLGKILVLAPGDKHSWTYRNEVKKKDCWPKANPAEEDQDTRDLPKPSNLFPEMSRGMNCAWQLICIEIKKLIYK